MTKYVKQTKSTDKRNSCHKVKLAKRNIMDMINKLDVDKNSTSHPWSLVVINLRQKLKSFCVHYLMYPLQMLILK